jgi:hypothetical protein
MAIPVLGGFGLYVNAAVEAESTTVSVRLTFLDPALLLAVRLTL